MLRLITAFITVYRGYDANSKTVSASMVAALLFIVAGILSYFGFSTGMISDDDVSVITENINAIIPAASTIVGVLFAWLRKRKDRPMPENNTTPQRRRTDQPAETYLDDYYD